MKEYQMTRWNTFDLIYVYLDVAKETWLNNIINPSSQCLAKSFREHFKKSCGYKRNVFHNTASEIFVIALKYARFKDVNVSINNTKYSCMIFFFSLERGIIQSITSIKALFSMVVVNSNEYPTLNNHNRDRWYILFINLHLGLELF